MSTIIVHAHPLADMPDGATLVERVVPAAARDEHYLAQLLQRVVWALADADDLEPRAVEANTVSTAGAVPRAAA